MAGSPRERPEDESSTESARIESSPRVAIEVFRAEFHLEHEDGAWVLYLSPDEVLRATSREEAIRIAHAALLRRAAAQIERGELNPPESFTLALRHR